MRDSTIEHCIGSWGSLRAQQAHVIEVNNTVFRNNSGNAADLWIENVDTIVKLHNCTFSGGHGGLAFFDFTRIEFYHNSVSDYTPQST